MNVPVPVGFVMPSVNDLLRKSNGSVIECKMCSRKFKQESQMRCHIVKVHKIVESQSDKSLFHGRISVNSGSTSNSPALRYCCPDSQCEYYLQSRSKHNLDLQLSFGSMKLLKQHFLRRHTIKKFTCCFCNLYAFALERDLRYHMKRCCERPDEKVKTINQILLEPSKPMSVRKREGFTAVKPQPIRVTPVNNAAPFILPKDSLGVRYEKIAGRISTFFIVQPPPLPKPNGPRCLAPKVAIKDCKCSATQTVSRSRSKTLEWSRNNCRSNNAVVSTGVQCDLLGKEQFTVQHVDQAQDSGFLPMFYPNGASSSMYMANFDACVDSSSQVAAVQQDIFCQTYLPLTEDASVMADICSAPEDNFDQYTSLADQWTNTSAFWPHFEAGVDFFGGPSTNIETQTDFPLELMEFLVAQDQSHMETQTTGQALLESHTQTSFIDFMDTPFNSAGTQTF